LARGERNGGPVQMNPAPLETLLSKLLHVKKSGPGWSACCPAHVDRRSSLSIAVGDGGRVLAYCHAGCSFAKICEVLGLTPGALFSDGEASLSLKPSKTRQKSRYWRHDSSAQAKKAFATAEQAIEELERQHGPKSASWDYHDELAKRQGVIIRWDVGEGEKDIRPVSLHEDGWRIGGMPTPRLLYQLPLLKNAPSVFVTEGEKAADAARSLGLVATTSPHGAKSADKADWSSLAGKEVIILPDNDAAGGQYAQDVAAILLSLRPASTVKIVSLPNLPEHGDVVDYIAANATVETATVREQVEQLVRLSQPLQPKPATPTEKPKVIPDRDHSPSPHSQIQRFRMFPVNALPEPVRSYVATCAKSICCDLSYIALPLLTAIAAAIGNTRRLRLKHGWYVPPIIWTVSVGESGSAKSPGYKAAMEPLNDRQDVAMEVYTEAAKDYAIAQARYEKELAAWKREKKNQGDPPERPAEPYAERYIVSDTTIEALAPLLLQNSRGLLLARDELAAWFGSFDRYAGAKKVNGDAAQWLSMYNADRIVVDRKTGQPKTIYVPRAAMCVTGTIQPAILHQALGSQHRQSGLAARLLMTCPPRKSKPWTEAEIPPKQLNSIRRVFDRLYALEPTVDEQGRATPVQVELTPVAKSLWVAWCNAHNEELLEFTGERAAAWSKLEEIPARLALILHFIRWAALDPTITDQNAIDDATMAAAIELTEWFKYETRRIYDLLAESPEHHGRRRLIELMERHGGRILRIFL